MDAPTLFPAYDPSQTRTRAVLGAAAYLLFYASAALLVGLVILYYYLAVALWMAVWLSVHALPYLPGFLFKCTLVFAGVFGIALVFPAVETAFGAIPALREYWPLVLALALPVPLALLVDRLFFRR